MASNRSFLWQGLGVGMLPVAVIAAGLLIGGVAHSAPPTAPNPAEVLAPIPTTTTLTVSPGSTAVQGSLVTLTAAISPSTAVGTVQFKDGTTNIGPPVTVSNNGTAAGSTSLLALGSHQLTAVFTPTNPAAFSPSTSPAVPYVIGVAPGTANNAGMAAGTGTQTGTTTQTSTATQTSTMLVTSPASVAAPGSQVTLTATITPSTAVGNVQFKDGATDIGPAVTVSNNGTASGSTALLAPGPHQLTAVFTPTDPATFGPSTSPAVPLTVTGSPAAGIQTCPAQQSGLSLDVHLSLLGDHNNQVTVLDGGTCSSLDGCGCSSSVDRCGCSSSLDGGGCSSSILGVSIPLLDNRATILDQVLDNRVIILDQRPSVDQRPAVLDGTGLLGGLVSVVLD
jgi:Bacterial Ig-like domain (group 3)